MDRETIACTICGATQAKEHTFREMMFGTRAPFQYKECMQCGFLQIAHVPDDLAPFYPTRYYSFAKPFSASKLLFYRLHFNAARYLPSLRKRGGAAFGAVMRANLRPGSRVLDVGCGSGDLVTILRGASLNCYGIDRFLVEESAYIRRATLETVEPGWDLIMFHHALEHMEEQISALRYARDKLNPGGTCLVRIPIAAWAWKHYRSDWVQLDAPRHLAIHTLTSFRHACARAGLEIASLAFDSGPFQFIGSELYRRDIPWVEASRFHFSKKQRKEFRRRAAELNRQSQGDQAAFYLKAIPVPGSPQGLS
jgi:SAM-dependent methyltransferase